MTHEPTLPDLLDAMFREWFRYCADDDLDLDDLDLAIGRLIERTGWTQDKGMP